MPFLMRFALEPEIVTLAWIDNAAVQFPLNIYATKGQTVAGTCRRGVYRLLRPSRQLRRIRSLLLARHPGSAVTSENSAPATQINAAQNLPHFFEFFVAIWKKLLFCGSGSTDSQILDKSKDAFSF